MDFEDDDDSLYSEEEEEGEDLSIDYFLNLPYLKDVGDKVEEEEDEDDEDFTNERAKVLKMRKREAKKMYNMAFNRESRISDIPMNNMIRIRSFIPSKDKKKDDDIERRFFHMTEIPHPIKPKKKKRNIIKAGSQLSRVRRHNHVKSKVNSHRNHVDVSKVIIGHTKQKNPDRQELPKTPGPINTFVRNWAKTPRIEKRINRERLTLKKQRERIMEGKLASIKKLKIKKITEEELVFNELDLEGFEKRSNKIFENTPVKVLYHDHYKKDKF